MLLQAIYHPAKYTQKTSTHLSWKALRQYFGGAAWYKYSYMTVVKQPAGNFMSL